MRRADVLRFSAAQRFWWALCLAVLLPLAQAATAAHALSHVRADAAETASGKTALHLTHCDLCLSAAALQGGALPSSPPAPLPPAVHDTTPAARLQLLAFAAPARHYESRAPPSLLN
jgi:hypothetical protein